MNREMIRDRFPIGNDELTAQDGRPQVDKFSRGILFEKLDDGYGNSILKKVSDNSVVLGGAILALEHLTGATATFKPTTLNEIYNISATASTNVNTTALFGCGTGGSGLDFGSIVAPDIKQRDILELVPMRYGAAVTGDDASKYFFKKENADKVTSSWYLKQFDGVPVIKSLWKNGVDTETDGTEITSDVHDSKNTEGIETFAEFNISLNTSDIREYFEAIGKLSSARYNTIGFYTGEKVGTEYANVRLFSVVTFNNRDVSVKTKSSFVYRVYTLI